MKKGRLEKYLELQEGFSEEINKFRRLKINLVKNNKNNKNLVKNIENLYKIDESIIDVINDLNKMLKKKYSGTYIFDFVDSIDNKAKIKRLEELKKFDKNFHYSIKYKLYDLVDKLEQMKNSIENK